MNSTRLSSLVLLPLAMNITLACGGMASAGQELIPTPVNRSSPVMLTAEEWAEVREEDNPTKRTRKLMGIAARRLAQGQAFIQREHYDDVLKLLEQYKQILTYTMDSVDSLPDPERKRHRNAYKEIDLALRKHIPILQEIKRNFPHEHSMIEDSLLTAQRLRLIALNRFSGTEIFKIP